MRSKIEIGLKWGHIQVIGCEKDWKEYRLGPGATDNRLVDKYKCQCSCGNEFWVWEDDWKGKKNLKDCGCGISERDGMTVNFSVCMPMKYSVWLRNKAKKMKLSKSAVIVQLIQEQMEEKQNAESKDDRGESGNNKWKL